jgi:long-chain acyl-CoA synthetase
MPTESVPGRLLAAARIHAARPALRFKERGVWRSIPYAELADRVEALARGFIALGMAPGDRVCLFAVNSVEWILTDLAVLAAGGVTVPIYATSSEATARFILLHSEAEIAAASGGLPLKLTRAARTIESRLRTVVCFDSAEASGSGGRLLSLADLAARGASVPPSAVAERIAALRPDDVATIIYTSGTTGEPKGAMLTHRNLLSNIDACLACFPVEAGDVTLSFLPFSHALERTAGIFLMLASGVTVALAEDVNALPQNLLEIRPTLLIAVPRVLEKSYARILDAAAKAPAAARWLFWRAVRMETERLQTGGPRRWCIYLICDLLFFRKIRGRLGGRLKILVSGGAALAPEINRFFRAVGVPVIEGYGLTETSPVVTFNRPDRVKIGTVGPAIPGVEIRLAKDGEILVRGPNVMKGYFRNEKATAEAIDGEGWLKTEDVGEIDADGFLRITDRKKELVVLSGGKKAAPQPMENELKLDPLVSQACVVGEGRNYLAVLIVPDLAVLKARLGPRGAMLADPEVRGWYQAVVDRFNSHRASFETIKRFALLPNEWTIEAGEITPTLKLRRKIIVSKYAKEIEALYR